MKEWILDTPVFLTFFVRSETLQRTFEVIRRVRPRILFLVGDGPRNENDSEKIEECHKILENIDWNCQVHRYYAAENRGILVNCGEGLERAFEIVDRLIFLEDDILCADSFFWFCQELLKKYENDSRVQMICGQNLEGESEGVKSDYFFARRLSSGCIGIWRDRFNAMDYSYPIFEDSYLTEILVKNIPARLKSSKHVARAKRDRNEYLKLTEPKSLEVVLTLNFYLNHGLSIIPQKNMAVSIGLSEDSAHAPNRLEKLPKGIRRVFQLPIHEVSFPLKHPQYMLCDVHYEEKWCRILAEGYPFVTLWRFAASFMLNLRYDGLRKALKTSIIKVRRRIKKTSDING